MIDYCMGEKVDKKEIINRLQLYCMNNKSVIQQGTIKGINPKTGTIILEKDGEINQCSLEMLEKNEIKLLGNNAIFDDVQVKDKSVNFDEKFKMKNCEVRSPQNLKELIDIFKSNNTEDMEKICDQLFRNYELDEIMNIMMEAMAKVAVECTINDIEFSTDILAQYDITGKKIT